MLGTKVHFHRRLRSKRIRQESEGALASANDARFFLGSLDQRLAFAHGQIFLAIRAISFPGDAIPAVAIQTAATTWDKGFRLNV
jgi:hypothetical protein